MDCQTGVILSPSLKFASLISLSELLGNIYVAGSRLSSSFFSEEILGVGAELVNRGLDTGDD